MSVIYKGQRYKTTKKRFLSLDLSRKNIRNMSEIKGSSNNREKQEKSIFKQTAQ